MAVPVVVLLGRAERTSGDTYNNGETGGCKISKNSLPLGEARIN